MCAPCVQNSAQIALFHAPRAVRLRTREENNFLLFSTTSLRKISVFQPEPNENLAYKYNSPHLKLFIQNKAIQEKGNR